MFNKNIMSDGSDQREFIARKINNRYDKWQQITHWALYICFGGNAFNNNSLYLNVFPSNFMFPHWIA